MISAIIWGVLLLSICVFFHELGHYLAARMVGWPVPIFSIGFGARLFGREIGGTDFRVSAVPLGGYVALKRDALPEMTRLRQAIVTASGPLASALLAVVILFALNMAKTGTTLNQAVLRSLADLQLACTVMIQSLQQLFTGQLPLTSLTGPIGVAQIAADAARFGLHRFVLILAVVSLNLGLVNLLPLPPLDGYSLFLLAIESVLGRSLKDTTKRRINIGGSVLVGLSVVISLVGDIQRLFHK